ncbi:MAG: RES family NAD+ phosphorylase [Gammaproteobacteria bacterium]|nr:RES family NAD+ phosphorylase [Gammaproteobacteria bacterium]
MLTAWRICKTEWVERAFDGEGARLYGGRWNSAGRSMVYTAGTLSLAALEMLVHLEAGDLERGYSVVPVTFDAELATDLTALPRDWREDPAPVSTREAGDAWLLAGKSAALRVPSTIIPQEYNYLLNPRHADFGQIRVGGAESFRFDRRLKT